MSSELSPKIFDILESSLESVFTPLSSDIDPLLKATELLYSLSKYVLSLIEPSDAFFVPNSSELTPDSNALIASFKVFNLSVTEVIFDNDDISINSIFSIGILCYLSITS